MDLQEILDSVDIVEYISQFVELEDRGDEWWGLSPFKHEETPSFSVRREAGVFKDFASGLGGNCYSFIRFYFKVSNAEAVRILKKYANIDDNDTHFDVRHRKLAATQICKQFSTPKKSHVETKFKTLPRNYMDRYEDRPDKLEIWRKEGISDESMQTFGVKYDGFSNCIVYPIKNIDGDIVNIGGRTLDPDFKAKGIRKYTYFKKWKDIGGMKIVFGLYENMSEIKKRGEVIVFEGLKSVLLARDYGFKNCGALLTSHCNPEQLKILAKLGVNVVFALDKDADPTKDHNIQKLRRYVSVSYLFDFKNLLGEKDSPVDRGSNVFKTLYEECKYRF